MAAIAHLIDELQTVDGHIFEDWERMELRQKFNRLDPASLKIFSEVTEILCRRE